MRGARFSACADARRPGVGLRLPVTGIVGGGSRVNESSPHARTRFCDFVTRGGTHSYQLRLCWLDFGLDLPKLYPGCGLARSLNPEIRNSASSRLRIALMIM